MAVADLIFAPRALPLLVVIALALAVTLLKRLRRRAKVEDVKARARLLARASLLGALRRGLGEAYLVLGQDEIDAFGYLGSGRAPSGFRGFRPPEQAKLTSSLEPVPENVDCLLIRKHDLSPVCAVALGEAPETPGLDVPVVTLPLKRAYALQDVDAALEPLLNAPPATPKAASGPGEERDADVPPHSSQRDAPRLPNALPTG